LFLKDLQVSSKDIADIEDIMPLSKRPRKMLLDEKFNFGDRSDDELSSNP